MIGGCNYPVRQINDHATVLSFVGNCLVTSEPTQRCLSLRIGSLALVGDLAADDHDMPPHQFILAAINSIHSRIAAIRRFIWFSFCVISLCNYQRFVWLCLHSVYGMESHSNASARECGAPLVA